MMKCKEFTPRLMNGLIERHQCYDCGEFMEVCANCGGDYHANPEHRAKCKSKRLNNIVLKPLTLKLPAEVKNPKTGEIKECEVEVKI